MGLMAVGTLQIQIPIRALWWVQKLAVRRGMSGERWVEDLVLRTLEANMSVDLSRTPTMEE